ncbi:MAG: hypothetical protein CMJ76_02620 [Planctomycetaceae bacterium]|nr:hypothetical protein [Planctomycetaceae bacterium]|tara:strand:+ start:67 stop:609 length:543 start_codon:yes stop_codon:yes gene_type:complete
MFRAFFLGLSVSLLLVGLEGLAIERVVIAPPELLHGQDVKPMQIQVTNLAAWLAIGLGTSLTLYTIFTRQPTAPPITKNQTVTKETSGTLQLAVLDYGESDDSFSTTHVAKNDNKTEGSEIESSDDLEESDEYEYIEYEDEVSEGDEEVEYEDEQDDISTEEFDLDAFNEEFDIDDLLSE